MKLETSNVNYAATIVAIPATRVLPKCDNIVGVSLFGSQAIVSKDTTPGTIGVYFPAECQLSAAFLKANNLYRHKELNSSPEGRAGFFEDNGRVRAIKFRGVRSDCFFIPVQSLSFACDTSKLKVGDTFDKIDGIEICRKYLRKLPNESKHRMPQKKERFDRVDSKFMPEHFDTANYWRNKHLIGFANEIIITQKLHGTSVRFANTVVNRKLTLVERVLKWLGFKIRRQSTDTLTEIVRLLKT